ncbi:MAG: hypothetical protein ACOH2V_10530 [Candidatus Saccharimonadaceae bacterium]
MSVKPFEQGKILAPFLASPLEFIPGQDPLGLINVGERTYDKLLPGLNNVTERIRFYCFYCWFFDVYALQIGIVSKKEQFKYLRRAEYLNALLAAKNNWQGIAGITKARKLYNSSAGIIYLTDGTGEGQVSFDNTYWKNPRGVFGQNYVNSMVLLGLVKEREEGEGVYIRTDYTVEGRVSGLQLAQAFQENVGSDASETFIEVIMKGYVTQNQLVLLTDKYNMRMVPNPSAEIQLVWQLLMGPDEPKNPVQSFYRRRTIQLLLLKTIKKGDAISALGFTLDAYHQKGVLNGITDETLLLWYYFQLEQFWHMLSSGSLQAFLKSMNQKTGGSWIEEDSLISEIAMETCASLQHEGYIDNDLTFNNIRIVDEAEELLVLSMNKSKPINQISFAIILLRKLIANNNAQIIDLEKLSIHFQLNSQSNFVFSVSDLVKYGNDELKLFIAYFIKRYIVLRHQWVALKKMNDTQSTEKFVREDGLIRFLNPIDYGYSDQRIDTMLNFLTDLQILKENRVALTAFGTKLYNEIV